MPVWTVLVSMEAHAQTEMDRLSVSVYRHMGETSVRPVSYFAFSVMLVYLFAILCNLQLIIIAANKKKLPLSKYITC